MAKQRSSEAGAACQHCGALVFPDAKRCNQCGRFPIKLHRCPKCGMISEPTCQQCPRCGRPLDPDGDYL